jgi:hypothetical protein
VGNNEGKATMVLTLMVVVDVVASSATAAASLRKIVAVLAMKTMN